MNLCSFNCRGLKDPNRLSKVISICQSSGVQLQNMVLNIQETKIESLTKGHLKILEYFDLNYEIVPAVNQAGGLITIFPKCWSVKKVYKSAGLMFLDFQNVLGLFVNVYINPLDYSLEHFNVGFSKLDAEKCEKIYLSGDLNALASRECSTNPNIMSNDIRLIRFRKIVMKLFSIHLNHIQPAPGSDIFTHFDKRTGSLNQIDHFFTTDCSYFFDTKNIAFSDHRLLILRNVDDSFFCPSYWKFNDNVLQHHVVIQEIIRASCNSVDELDSYDTSKNLIRDKLRSLCIQCARVENHEESAIIKEIRQIENAICQAGSNEVLLRQLSHFNSQLLMIQNLKARKDLRQIKNFFTDFHHGDPHTVKKHVKRKRMKSRITAIKINESEISYDEEKIHQEFVHHFTERFSKPRLTHEQFVQSSLLKNQALSDFCSKNTQNIQDIRNLCSTRQEIMEQEVKQAIRKLNSESAPGLDGLTSNFYKAHADFFVPYLTKVFNLVQNQQRVPESFRNAVVKFIPKKETSDSVEDYRPISLINTDQKILSHVLTARLIDPLSKIIGVHQSAHLPNRNIHSSLMKINLNLETLEDSDCLVAVDFSKAFDRIDRRFLFLLLQAIGIDDITLKLIKAMYEKTIAFLDINGYLSTPVQMENGVRQGCPMSALLFDLGVEPVLQCIRDSNTILSNSIFKVIAYADDLTCCIKKESFDQLMDTLNWFSQITNLVLNHAKTEILCPSQFDNGITTKETAKILGVTFEVGNPKIDMSSMTSYAEKSRFFCNKFNTFVARAKNIDTFVMQKLIHQVRHKTALKRQLETLDNIFVDSIWLGRKHNLKKSVLQKSWSAMGIALKNFTKTITSSKIIDLKNFLGEDLTGSFFEMYRKTSHYKNLINLVRTFNCTLHINQGNQIHLLKGEEIKDLTLSMRTKEIYKFLSDSDNSDALQRITKISSKICYPPEHIYTFIRQLWKHPSYAAFEKNYLYQFLMNCYLDKPKKCELGWVFDCFCCFCGSAEESHSHLLFECTNVPNLNFFQVTQSINLSFLDPGDIYPFKRLIALLLSSWSGDSSKFQKYFLDCINLRNPSHFNSL